MKIKITTDRNPFFAGRQLGKGDVIEATPDEAATFIANGFGEEIKASAPKRARNAKGKLKADDPSTPDINEAWEGGKAPKKRGRPKKNAK